MKPRIRKSPIFESDRKMRKYSIDVNKALGNASRTEEGMRAEKWLEHRHGVTDLTENEARMLASAGLGRFIRKLAKPYVPEHKKKEPAIPIVRCEPPQTLFERIRYRLYYEQEQYTGKTTGMLMIPGTAVFDTLDEVYAWIGMMANKAWPPYGYRRKIKAEKIEEFIEEVR